MSKKNQHKAHRQHQQHHHHKPRKFRMLKFLKVSLVYFFLFVALFSMIDYYAMMAFNVMWFVVPSLVAAFGLGFYHVKYGKRDHVDDIANELL